jgi:tripartite-type tricarboxylate transporter receptor subunit TctC
MKAAILTAVLAICAGTALAQEKFPNRPVDVICNWAPGGGADQLARTLSGLAQKHLGTALPVSNAPGASGNTGLGKLLGARPDGYTIGTLTGITVAAWAGGLGTPRPGDLEYIVLGQSSPSMLFVKTDGPYGDVSKLFAYAKGNPGRLKVATAGFGTIDDLTLKFLASKGIRMTNAPYAQAGERYASMLGGHTDVVYEEPGDVKGFLDAKQYKPVIVFAAKRMPDFPDVPTSVELGLPIEFPNWRGVVTKAGVPPERLRILADAYRKAFESAEWKAFCVKDWSCVEYKTPEEFKKFVHSEFDAMTAFMKEHGLLQK